MILFDDDFVITWKYYSLIYSSCFDSYLEFSKMSLIFRNMFYFILFEVVGWSWFIVDHYEEIVGDINLKRWNPIEQFLENSRMSIVDFGSVLQQGAFEDYIPPYSFFIRIN